MTPNRKLRTVLGLALLLCLLVGLLPAPVAQADSSGACGKFLKWNLKDGTLTISGEGDMADYSSDARAPWGTDFTELRIEEGVTSIGTYAFAGCSVLTDVNLPDSLVEIGAYAFFGCSALHDLSLPGGVSSIGASAFASCPQLTLTVARGSYPEAYCRVDNLSFRFVGFCGKSGDNLTWTLDADGTLTISGSGEMADFKGDDFPWNTDAVKELVIEDGVTSIGDYAFAFCDSLSSVTIPDSVTSIGNNPFAGCAALKQIQVSPRHTVLAVIDGVLFSKPDKLLICYPSARETHEYTIPDGIRGVGDWAFAYGASLTSITIPDSVTSIGERAFVGCDSLSSVTIPDSVTSIGDGTFVGCVSLSSVTIPDSVTSIGDSAFGECNSLTSITIPDSVTSIGDYAFISCDCLTSITIPDGVTFIGDSTFAYCNSLTSVTIPASVTSIGKDAFTGCPLLTLTVERDSFAEQYCVENGLTYTFPDALDWLKD